MIPNQSIQSTVQPTPSSIVNYNERLQATIPIKYPDEIVSEGGLIWVKTDDGHVVAVDPASNQVTGDIKVDTTTDPSNYCQGLATDGDNIWACSASGDADHKTIDVVRIDPVSKTVVATIPVGKIFDQFDMPLLQGRIWVISGNADKLVGIDVKTNQAAAPIDLGARCFQLAAMKDTLLASCPLDDLILQIDPEKGQVIARVSIKDPRFLVTAAKAVWVAQNNAVVRLDPETLNPIVTFTGLSGVGLTGDIYATDDAVWVRQDSGFLYRIDPETNQIVEQVQMEKSISGGSLLATSDAVWTTASDDDMLIRLSR
jgi:outer membrane protein assembly factor BamB